ncbi:MAG: GNAT family N-acetyltransferase [Flavobacteriales bacterium]
MRLQRYGIELESLNQDHIEMIRLWRNQDFVRSNMQYQELLSRADQQAWFNGLDESKNLYWLIRFKGYSIGLIHIKNLSADSLSGEAGIFIGEPSYLEMPQPMLAIIFMMELAFEAMGMQELKAKIKSGNEHAINFNLKLGYRLIPNQPAGFQYYSVNKSEFDEATIQLRKSAQKMYGDSTGFDSVSSDGLKKTVLNSILANPYFKSFSL